MTVTQRLGFIAALALGVASLNAQGIPATRLTLANAIDMALAHNRKLELAGLAIREGEEQKRIAESRFYPVLNNQSKVVHISELQGVVIPPGAFSVGSAGGSVPAQTVRIDQGASTAYTSNTALEQPLTQLFLVHAGVRAAKADLETAKIHASDTRNEVALAVHQLYYALLIQQMNHSVAEDALKASTAADDENLKGVSEGRLLADAELASRAEMLDKQRAVLIAKLNLEDLTLQLDDLLGLAIGTRLELDPEVQGDASALPSRKEAMDKVLQLSPTVLEARQGVEKAKAGLSAARDAYIPNVSGLAQYSYQSGLPFLEHNFGTFGASFSYDLFEGGARAAKVRDASVKLSMAKTILAQDESDVEVQISAAYDRVEEIQKLLEVSQSTLTAREESYRVQAKRKEVDAALASAVASAHASAVTARLNVLTSQLDLFLAQSQVKKLLGELPR